MSVHIGRTLVDVIVNGSDLLFEGRNVGGGRNVLQSLEDAVEEFLLGAENAIQGINVLGSLSKLPSLCDNMLLQSRHVCAKDVHSVIEIPHALHHPILAKH